MGYISAMFKEIGRLDFPGKNVLDVGAQDVSVFSIEDLNDLNEFIKTRNPSGAVLEVNQFPCIVEAREIYVRAGFQYTCIDVDERAGVLRVDLAKFEIPHPRSCFGLVVNVGTTEHLSSPAAAFALMHEMCAVGGVVYHDVPVFGFGNHGMINPTPKFWHALIWMNDYFAESVRIRKLDESTVDKGNFFHNYLDYMSGLSSISGITFLITAVLKKQTRDPFIVPYDAVFPDSDSGLSLARLLYGLYYPFLRTGAYTKTEVIGGINRFLSRNGRSFRVAELEALADPEPALACGVDDQKGRIKSMLSWLSRR